MVGQKSGPALAGPAAPATTALVFCLHHLLPYVGNIGTNGTNGITNGTIGKTLNGICLPMVPFLPLEKTTNARIIVGSFLERHGVRLQVPLRGRSSEIPWNEVNSIKTVVLHWYLVLST